MKKRPELRSVSAASFLLLIVITAVSWGAERAGNGGEHGGMGYSMFGTFQLDLDNLNSALEAKGYNGFPDNLFSVGGGGHGIINRIIIGGEGHSLLGKDQVSGIYESSLVAGYGLFDLGYIVYSSHDLRLYPLVGLGGGGIDLTIKERDTAVSFDEVLVDPERKVDLSTAGFLLNVAVGMDYLISFGQDRDGGRGGFLLGIRAGYMISPFQGDWSMGELEVAGGPDLGLTGPYVRVMFGGGGIEP